MAMPWSSAIIQPMFCQPMSMAKGELVERNERQKVMRFLKVCPETIFNKSV
jgi:hypothetical protein